MRYASAKSTCRKLQETEHLAGVNQVNKEVSAKAKPIYRKLLETEHMTDVKGGPSRYVEYFFCDIIDVQRQVPLVTRMFKAFC